MLFKMAAPCGATFRRLGLKFVAVASLRASPLPKVHPHCIRKYTTPQSQSSTLPVEPKTLKWHLMSAVCLERYPVVSHDLTETEREYGNMIDTLELEGSLLSDHELQVTQDKERMMKRQSGDLDEDEDEGRELVSALDLEDQYTDEFNKFIPASRVSDTDDLHSLHRKLMDKLVLLVKCRVGGSSLWMMPQGTRQDGETMRQVAERILVSQCGLTELWRARVFGNAPSACYKYNYPPDVQEETQVRGAKVFFYKARLMMGDIRVNKDIIEDYAWVTPGEMDKYLVPSYLDTIRKIIIPINVPR